MNHQRGKNKSQNAVSLDEIEAMVKDENVLLMRCKAFERIYLRTYYRCSLFPMDELLSKLKNISRDQEIIVIAVDLSAFWPIRQSRP